MGLLRLNNSPGARAFYDQYRTDGDTHHQPLRGPPPQPLTVGGFVVVAIVGVDDAIPAPGQFL